MERKDKGKFKDIKQRFKYKINNEDNEIIE